jgi:hypothetical protein
MTDLFIICIASACLVSACFLFGVWVGRGEPEKKSGQQGGKERRP